MAVGARRMPGRADGATDIVEMFGLTRRRSAERRQSVSALTNLRSAARAAVSLRHRAGIFLFLSLSLSLSLCTPELRTIRDRVVTDSIRYTEATSDKQRQL